MEPGDLPQRFEILSVLGQGGMGTVYRARDTVAARDVALKVIAADDVSEAMLLRFRREGEITASLNHPGIVRVFSAGHLEGRAYLACELVEGARTLSDAWRGAPLEQRVGWVLDAARALGAAHEQGVVHRDVKPDNILVDVQGRLRVADFGLAAARGMSRLTKTGALLGTPSYMAPEQFGGEVKQVGPTADVWALGVVLYEALTHRLPYSGASFWELGAQIAKATPQPPRTLDPEIPRDLELVCLRAMAREPDERYPSAGAMADDLARALSGERVSASGGVGAARLLRSRAVWSALIVTCSLLLLAYAVVRDPGEPSPPSDPAASPSPPPRPEPAADAIGFRLRQGQSFRTYLEIRAGGVNKANKRHDYLLRIDLREQVRAVRNGVATIEARVPRLRLRITEPARIDYDSNRTGADAAKYGIRWDADRSFSYRLELATGRIKKMIGVTSYRRALWEGAPTTTATVVEQGLDQLDDRRFGDFFEQATRVLEPQGAFRGRVGFRRVALVECQTALTRRGLQVVGRQVSWKLVARHAPGIEVDWFRLHERRIVFAEGRVRSARIYWTSRTTGPQEVFQGSFEVRYADAQVPRDWKAEPTVSGNFMESAWRKAAEKGDPHAMLELGKILHKNEDQAGAVGLYRRAAELGNSEAMHKLADAYQSGRGVPAQDVDQALAWYVRAGKAGRVRSIVKAARLLEGRDIGAKRDLKRALEMWEWAATFGRPEAWYQVGQRYLQVPGGTERALRGFRLAASSGHLGAAHRLIELLLLKRVLGDAGRMEGLRWLRFGLGQKHGPTLKLAKRHPTLIKAAFKARTLKKEGK